MPFLFGGASFFWNLASCVELLPASGGPGNPYGIRRYGILAWYGILVGGLFWIFVAFGYGILLVRFSLVFCVFRGRCLWIFFWLVVVFGPCRYGIWVFCIGFAPRFFSYLFFRIFSRLVVLRAVRHTFSISRPARPGIFP